MAPMKASLSPSIPNLWFLDVFSGIELAYSSERGKNPASILKGLNHPAQGWPDSAGANPGSSQTSVATPKGLNIKPL
jgi:hypothetical protein